MVSTVARLWPLHCAAELGTLVAAIGVALQRKWVQSEQRRHHRQPAVTVLDIGGMQHQPRGVDQEMVLPAFDFPACVIARRVDRGRSFSAPLTLWLSITAAVGEALRPAFSRHLT
jgi:hypothetical protein